MISCSPTVYVCLNQLNVELTCSDPESEFKASTALAPDNVNNPKWTLAFSRLTHNYFRHELCKQVVQMTLTVLALPAE